MLEIEVKSKINKEEVEENLKNLGVSFSEAVLQHDNIYFPIGINFENVLPETPVQRIRITESKAILTLKLRKSKENNLDKIEYETEVENPEIIHKMLELMSFYKAIDLKKYRRKAKYNGYELCLDSVEELGDFLEIEALSEEDDKDLNEVRDNLWKFAESVGAKQDTCEQIGYDILLYKQNKLKV